MRTFTTALAILMMLAASGSSQQGGFTTPSDSSPEGKKLAASYDPARATYITEADIQAAIKRLPAEGNSVNGVWLERADPSSTSGLGYRMQIDRRRPPQNATAHRTEAELWVIVGGSGVVTTGGKIVETKKGEKVVSRAVQGGESRKVTKGDLIMIPEGVPHYVSEASPELYFVAIEFPRPPSPLMPAEPSK
jgi:mannose-6-phosphate isomerase-like protein (cupin superfamily)